LSYLCNNYNNLPDIVNKFMRIALGIEYDGSAFHGWQRQDHDAVLTVQACVEEALSAVANHPVHVICAGRTDAGVHALGQVIHFDTESSRSEHAWIFGANSNLTHDICIVWSKVIDDSFHARFSAKTRKYRYIIYNFPVRSALGRHHVTWYHRQLDEKRMDLAAKHLIGEHDFSSFRGVGCQSKTPMREIFTISVQRQNDFVILDVKANSFLHHMVRNIAGVLLEIGEGKRDPSWVKDLLQQRDRTKAGVTAPANGLYLTAVEYPKKYQLPPAIPANLTRWGIIKGENRDSPP
jgi:tRNA pseudouridine38-40 synthase